MRRRLLVFTSSIVIIACPIAATPADNPTVDMFPNAANYSGPCPVDIVFTATLNDDSKIVYGYHFYGGGFNATKELYGYIPDSGSSSEDDDITVDASHAGKITRSIEVKFEKLYPNGYTETTVRTASADAVVTCAAAVSPEPSASG
ncbi:MAG TPA: hypothetical protein VFO25_05280 [Candidatus Eremiobacteraceae bacterium]|nr:hypothetical protein [Candidatus Eremiobacteraceae bacterium]